MIILFPEAITEEFQASINIKRIQSQRNVVGRLEKILAQVLHNELQGCSHIRHRNAQERLASFIHELVNVAVVLKVHAIRHEEELNYGDETLDGFFVETIYQAL